MPSSRRIRRGVHQRVNAIFKSTIAVIRPVLLGRVIRDPDMHLNTTTIGHRHFGTGNHQCQWLPPRAGKCTNARHHQPADGIDFFIAEVVPKSVVEVFQSTPARESSVWRLS